MTGVVRDISRAFGQVFDPAFRGVLLKALGLTLSLLAGLCGLIWLLAAWLIPAGPVVIPLIGAEISWLSDAARGVALIGAIALSGLLMLPVAGAFVGLFLEEVAAAVEARWYPGMPPARRQPVGEALVQALRFFGILIAVNLLALLVYLISTVFAPFVFWAVNGYLIGREYFEMAGIRRMPAREAAALRRAHRLEVWALGTATAAALTVPLANLFAPVIAAAAFTHLRQRLADRH